MSKTSVQIQIHPDARIKGDRDKLTTAVLDLYRKHGALTPDILIAAARPRNSPLHNEFTWDADQALAEVQRSQALYLIRVISLEITEVDTGNTYRGREFVLNPVSIEPEYVSIRAALSDTEMRTQIVERLVARLDALREELERFEEFADVVQAITKTARRVKKKRPLGVAKHGRTGLGEVRAR